MVNIRPTGDRRSDSATVLRMHPGLVCATDSEQPYRSNPPCGGVDIGRRHSVGNGIFLVMRGGDCRIIEGDDDFSDSSAVMRCQDLTFQGVYWADGARDATPRMARWFRARQASAGRLYRHPRGDAASILPFCLSVGRCSRFTRTPGMVIALVEQATQRAGSAAADATRADIDVTKDARAVMVAPSANSRFRSAARPARARPDTGIHGLRKGDRVEEVAWVSTTPRSPRRDDVNTCSSITSRHTVSNSCNTRRC